jgi:hypothetical protein
VGHQKKRWRMPPVPLIARQRLVWDLGFPCDQRINHSGLLDVEHVAQIRFGRVSGTLFQIRPCFPLYCSYVPPVDPHDILLEP